MISNSYFLWDVPEPVHGSACGDNIAKFRALSAFEATPDFALLNATTYPPAGAHVGFLCKAELKAAAVRDYRRTRRLGCHVYGPLQLCRYQRAESQAAWQFHAGDPEELTAKCGMPLVP
jgi:hypothetical protein